MKIKTIYIASVTILIGCLLYALVTCVMYYANGVSPPLFVDYAVIGAAFFCCFAATALDGLPGQNLK
jgi:hypothetical protein